MLDKLYYIFHSSVRNGFGHAERASFLLSISIVAYFGALCFLYIVLAKTSPPGPFIGPAIFLILGIGTIYGTSRYFVRTGRYRRIIAKYGNPRALDKRTRFLYRVISIGIFFTGSFAAFVATGIMLSKYLNL